MGLSFASISNLNSPTPFDNLFAQGLIKDKIFSFWLNNNISESNGGQIFFGGSDPAYFTGNFTYLTVTDAGFWQFSMEKFVKAFFKFI
jgi:cathepsin D